MTTQVADWVEARWRALGTSVHLLVTEASRLPEARERAERELADLDRACSRFREDSELVGLTGSPAPVQVSPLLAAAVTAALTVADLTDGLVDPTLGHALVAAGYDRTFDALPSDGPTAVRLPPRRSTWRDVRLDGRQLTVPPDVLLDLGASAKAWASDRIADAVADLGTGVLVNLGGDLAVRGAVPEGGWAVELADRPDRDGFQVVTVDSGGLATSSTTARTWRRGGLVQHHVLDPATGLPAPTPWASVTVTAATCLEANAASTAAIVLGAHAPAWLAERGYPACLLDRTGQTLRVGGWPA
jgi:thiamine biosynthesis lipoprotein